MSHFPIKLQPTNNLCLIFSELQHSTQSLLDLFKDNPQNHMLLLAIILPILFDQVLCDHLGDLTLDQLFQPNGDHGHFADLLPNCLQFDCFDFWLFEFLFGLDDAFLDVDVVDFLFVMDQGDEFGCICHFLSILKTTYLNKQLQHTVWIEQPQSGTHRQQQMGVQSLWQLLLPIAKRITLDDLRGQTLAIDASIWMVKVQSIYTRIDQMILSIFNKIIMLLRAGIRPVFVFDGQTPDLKRVCVERRRRNMMQVADNEIKRKAQLEIVRLLKEGGRREPGEKEGDGEKKKKQRVEEVEEVLDEVDLMKLELYSQRLNQEYSMLLELNPHLPPDYSKQIFQTLTLPEREQIIKSYKARANFLRNQQYKQRRQQKASDKSYRQAFMEDLKRITKSAQLTKMRHDHYLEVMSKIQTTESKDGLEIARGKYGGRAFEMTRKQDNSKPSRWNKKDVPTKNNFLQILKRKIEGDDEENELPQPKEKMEEEEKKPQIDISDLMKRIQVQKPLEEIQPPMKEITQLPREKIKQSDQPQGDDDLFQDQQPEEPSQVTFRIDVDKLIQARNSTSRPSQTQPAASSQPLRNPAPSQPSPQLPDHITSYTAPAPLSPFIDNLQIKSLLDYLGLPYVNAPYQAQAQCAQLQMAGLVDGIVTQDSDIFLFGGRHVYRGVFQNDVKFYQLDRIKRELGMDREKCVIFAMFLGSDYTEGVKGVGIVNAMEILRVFDSVDRLGKLREWARLPDQLVEHHSYKGCTSDQIEFFQFHKNFKKYWYLDQDFPNKYVVDGYLKPKVQLVKQKFKFKQPDLDIIQRLLKEKFQMREQQTKGLLQTIDKAYKQYTLNRKSTIKDYFVRVDTVPCAIIKSKRLNKALGKDSK